MLAKRATGWRGKHRPKPPAPPWDFLIRLLAAQNRTDKDFVKRCWEYQWQTHQSGKALRALVPTITQKTVQIYKWLPRAACSVLVQARTGKIALRAYLHGIKRAEDNKCACGQVQTVRHILQECPDFKDLRQEVWGHTMPTCHRDMLNSHAKKTSQFLLKTGLLGQFKRANDYLQW